VTSPDCIERAVRCGCSVAVALTGWCPDVGVITTATRNTAAQAERNSAMQAFRAGPERRVRIAGDGTSVSRRQATTEVEQGGTRTATAQPVGCPRGALALSFALAP
jgi:hypothetical protein